MLLKISYQNRKLTLWNALAFMTDNANVSYVTVHSIHHLLQKEKTSVGKCKLWSLCGMQYVQILYGINKLDIDNLLC